MLGVIPITALVFYSNVFIGPSQLAEIPKDYVPEHWEYEKVTILKQSTESTGPSKAFLFF